MGALATAPGVIGAAKITYITAMDVMELLGCRENKAYQAIREVNMYAKSQGKFAYGQGKANKYMFAEKYGIPIEIVNSVIEDNRQGGV